MRFGTFIPQIGGIHDPIAVRDFAQAAEDLGYDFLCGYEHVIGVDPSNRQEGWRKSFTHESFLHEPFVLFGYLGAVTRSVEFTTAIMILPQRQTVLFAKQAAEVDYLTGGRLRLGLGLGWNTVEYEAMGADFASRGRRVEEQIEVMRLLWSNPVVEYHGRYHHIDRAGLNPLPVQRPIPIWFGGYDERVLRRIARIADGWLPLQSPFDATLRQRLTDLRRFVAEAGRAESDVGLQGRIGLKDATPDDWRRDLDEWRTLRASHVIVSTDEPGWGGVDAHIKSLREFAEVADIKSLEVARSSR
jgi:probable F420-dependent oxidoreductase